MASRKAGRVLALLFYSAVLLEVGSFAALCFLHRGFVGYAKGADPAHYDVEAASLMDAYRKGRDGAGFSPKGEGLLGDGGDT